ncbi:hypothetical protein GQ457_10G025090 [Hibiscus cannabinus]
MPRVRSFLWMCYRGCLLTNSERNRRHLTDDPSCSICGEAFESISHVLRGCGAARSIWPCVIQRDKIAEFLSMNVQQWLLLNLQEPNYFPKVSADWDIMFGSLLWLLWKRRNELVFNPNVCGLDNTLQQGQRMLQESLRARSPVRVGRTLAPWQPGLNVRWRSPPPSWIKVNTDGARSIRSGLATCGGIGRDSNGNWCFGFSRALGLCSALEAELWGVFEGLATAWSLGFPRVIVEMDCHDVYEMVALGNPKQLGSSLMAGILELQHRSWEIKFNFIKREGNVPADLMASLAWNGPPEYRRYMVPPPIMLEAIQFDRDFDPADMV